MPMSDPGDELWDLDDYPTEDFMAGGKKETDPEVLAKHCELFAQGAKRKYDAEAGGDMWLFELFHHMNDCAEALRKQAQLGRE